MRIATLRSGRRSLAIGAAATLVAALLVATGTPKAEATGESVAFQAASSNTPEGSAPVINVVLTNTAPPATPVVVTISAAGSGSDPAEAGDYTLSPNTVTFPASSASGTALPVSLTYTGDSTYENPETLTLTITNTTVGVIGAQSTHDATITNDDAAPTLTISDAAIAEGLGPMIFTVTRTGLTEVTAGATATASSGTGPSSAAIVDDFADAPGAISIAPGGPTNTDTFSVALVSDDVYEPNETFNVTLSGLVAGQPGDLAAVGTINDDDVPPTLSISDVSVAESAGTATFTITRTGRTAFDTDFDIATAGVTATSGADFTAQSDTLTILSGDATGSTTLVVPIVDDDIDENSETYSVTISNAPQATFTKTVGTGTITDNDTAGVTLTGGTDIFVLEGAAADTVGVSLASEPISPVTVAFSADTGQLTLSPAALNFDSTNWDTPQTLSVSAVEDGTDEEDPHTSSISVAVISADPKYSGLPVGHLVASIGDADALLVTIAGPSVGAPGEPVTFSAVVNAGGTGTITYEWTAFYLGNQIATGTQSSFQFTPANGGGYNIQVIISDDDGQNPAKFIQFRALSDIGSSVFTDDIVWLAEEGITKGCNPPDNDEFCPTDVVTRAQMAAFLVRFLGLTDDGGGNTFTDDNGSIFETDIAKLAEAGITRGCNPPTNDRFCPEDPVTREQMAAFLVRALALTDDGGGNTFTDDNGSIFETDIAKLAAAGITRGCNPPTNDQFCPRSPVTREQMAAFIQRAAQIP